MSKKCKPGKRVSDAGKKLSNPKSTKKEKSNAGKILANHKKKKY